MIKEVEEKLEVIKERRRSSIMAELAEGRERKPSVVDAIAHKVRSLSTTSAPTLDEKEEEDEEEKTGARCVRKRTICHILFYLNPSKCTKWKSIERYLISYIINYE